MRARATKGTTLIEVLIATAFFVAVVWGLYGAYARIIELTRIVRIKEVATSLGNEMLEVVRNLPYDDVGTVGGIPAGVVVQQQDVTRAGFTFRVNTTIQNFDQPFDGTVGGSPNDLSPSDNKVVEIKIRCLQCDSPSENPYTQFVTTTVAPRALESSSTDGSLFIYVIDADGNPIHDAEVHVDNGSLSPEIHLSDNTNADGVLQIIGAPPSVSSYDITATNSGSTTDETYTSLALGGATPVKPPATVAVQQITNITFQVDKVSSVSVSSVDAMCTPVGNFDFTMRGAKKIGTSPDVYKYDEHLVTNGSGNLSLSDVEWDSYTITPADSAYDLIGSNPLLEFTIAPRAHHDLELVVAPKDEPTVMVTVKDSATGLALTGADVELQKTSGGYDVTKTTGVGSYTQTDWSGGAGTATWATGGTHYFSDDGNIDKSGTPGTVKLRSTGGGSYVPSGSLISSTFDTGSTSNFYDLSWVPGSQPVGTGTDSVKFQIAGNNDNLTWNFVGPDGTATSYYTGTNFDLGNQNGNRYLRYKAFLSTSDTSVTPSLTDVSFTYTAACTPPGQVVFSGLSTGSYTLIVSKDGYNAAGQSISVASGSWQQAQVSLTQ